MTFFKYQDKTFSAYKFEFISFDQSALDQILELRYDERLSYYYRKKGELFYEFRPDSLFWWRKTRAIKKVLGVCPAFINLIDDPAYTWNFPYWQDWAHKLDFYATNLAYFVNHPRAIEINIMSHLGENVDNIIPFWMLCYFDPETKD